MNRLVFLVCWLATSLGFAQSFDLGENYLDQGEYEKAKSVFQQLHKRTPSSQKILLALVKTHKELEEFDEAEQLILDYTRGSNRFPNMLVELGYLKQLQEKNDDAKSLYNQAIELISEKPNFAYSVGSAFQDYNLLSEAIQTYEIANEIQPSTNFKVYLARLYGESGDLELMFTKYIDLIVDNPSYFSVVSRNFNDFITEDPDNESNTLLRKVLLKKSQQNPELVYTQLLSWLFVQQKEFKKAFVQERALLKREPDFGHNRLIELAGIAKENDDFSSAKEIYQFVIEDSASLRVQVQAVEGLSRLKIDTASTEDYPKIKSELAAYIEKYKEQSFEIELMYASFIAFQMQEYAEAFAGLKALLDTRQMTQNEARTRTLMGDILVAQERFNEGLIYYTQAEKLMKNHPIGQEAKFKIAKTSYYKGDFEWALTQLDVLRKSTSQLMANDALELSRHIKDNSYQDSIQTALQKVAKADWYIFQQQENKALSLLNEVVEKYATEPIEDEALIRMGRIHENLGNYSLAAEAYERIIQFHPNDILVDNAFFALAELYATFLNDPAKAKTYYEAIIFDHPDSIFYVDAQKMYRRLRGDQIE